MEECVLAGRRVPEEPHLLDLDLLLRQASTHSLSAEKLLHPSGGGPPRSNAVQGSRAIPLPSFREVSELSASDDSGLPSLRRSIRISDASPGTPGEMTPRSLPAMTPGPAEVRAIRPDTVFALVSDETELLALSRGRGRAPGRPRTDPPPSKASSSSLGKRGVAEAPPLRRHRSKPSACPKKVSRTSLCLSGFDANETETLVSVLNAVNGNGIGMLLRYVSEPGVPFDVVVAADHKKHM